MRQFLGYVLKTYFDETSSFDEKSAAGAVALLFSIFYAIFASIFELSMHILDSFLMFSAAALGVSTTQNILHKNKK